MYEEASGTETECVSSTNNKKGLIKRVNPPFDSDKLSDGPKSTRKANGMSAIVRPEV